MSKSFAQQLHHWSGKPQDILGWHWARKLDGFSCIWDGGTTRGKELSEVPFYDKSTVGKSSGLWSLGRTGSPTPFYAPEWWLNQLPVGVPLHGELWNEDDLQYIKSTVKCLNPYERNEEWKRVKFMAFMVKPFQTFQEGYQRDSKYYQVKLNSLYSIKSILETENFKIVPWVKINSVTQVVDILQKSHEENWEGLVFFNYDRAVYKNGRSRSILKYKPSHDDEATVIKYENGKSGKNLGKTGAIIASYTWRDDASTIHGGKESLVGKTIEVSICGLTDSERDNPEKYFPIGSTIGFTFFSASPDGIPMHSNIKRGEQK
jgi:hypothetical protein